MDVGQTVRFKGPAFVVGQVAVDPGHKGEVLGVYRFQEMWFAVRWEGLARPTFHLEKELDPLQT